MRARFCGCGVRKGENDIPGTGGRVVSKAEGIEAEIARLAVGVGEHVGSSDGEPVRCGVSYAPTGGQDQNIQDFGLKK